MCRGKGKTKRRRRDAGGKKSEGKESGKNTRRELIGVLAREAKQRRAPASRSEARGDNAESEVGIGQKAAWQGGEGPADAGGTG